MRCLVNGKPAILPEIPLSILDRDGVVELEDGRTAMVRRANGKIHVSFDGQVYAIEPFRPGAMDAAGADGKLRAPLPGAVVDVMVAEGDTVQKGDKLVILEAMKMQTVLVAPYDGVVSKVSVQKGSQVQDSEILVEVDPVA